MDRQASESGGLLGPCDVPGKEFHILALGDMSVLQMTEPLSKWTQDSM